jgi:hypothetical protein
MENIILPAPIVIYYQIHGANIESIILNRQMGQIIFSL